MSDIIVPSSIEDRKKLKLLLGEMVNQLQKIDFEKETYNEIRTEIKKQYELPPKVINKMAQTMHKHNFDDVVEEHEGFETLYETLVNSKTNIMEEVE